MCICFQRQTSFPHGELLHPPRRGVQVPRERRHSYLQLTLGYSEFTASNLHLGKAGQAQPTGNYRVTLPRTAPWFPQLVATGEVTEEPHPPSVPPHEELSLASDPFVSCQPGATRTKGNGASRCWECSAPTQSKRVQEGTWGSPRTSSLPGMGSFPSPVPSPSHLSWLFDPAFWALHSNRNIVLQQEVDIHICVCKHLHILNFVHMCSCYFSTIIITAQTCNKILLEAPSDLL